MKQALKQQGFVGLGRNQTEWRAWMEREKASLTEIAQAHEFEIISLGGGRPHMELPEFKVAGQAAGGCPGAGGGSGAGYSRT